MMLNKLLVNITWNSNDWKGLSDDESNHRYVKEGGVPSESWNFDFDNERNTPDIIYGFAQFTNPPKIDGDGNIIIFYSRNHIVGIYGKARLLKDDEVLDDVNLAGDRELSILLTNKINNVKEKGYFEDKERIGQIGFNYLKNNETIIKIIDDAIELNPDDRNTLEKIREWALSKENDFKMNELLNRYAKFLDHSDYDELYKWVAVQNFKENWDIEAEDFASMFDNSFQPENCNLWVSGMYYPRKMIMEFIRQNPDAVREMFRVLYDENRELQDRIEHVRNRSSELLSEIGKEDKNHYQDDRALLVYLSFRYPEDYYLYKYTMYKNFCDLTGTTPVPKHGSDENILNYFRLCEQVREFIEARPEIIQKHKSLRSENFYDDDANHLLTQDVIYCTSRFKFFEQDSHRNKPQIEKTDMSANPMNQSVNSIIFGPPGTGKTYHTVNKALQIVDPDFYEVNKNNREALTERYRKLLITDWAESKKKRIAFTTFHQSFTYEDFVEGIKPDVNNDGDLSYKIEDGIFKRICRKAKYYSEGEAEEARERIRLSDEDFKKAQFFKVSLGNSNKEEDDEIFQYCIDHGKISIGYLDHLDLKEKSETDIKGIVQDSSDLSEFSSRAMNYFIHYLKKGHYVLVSKGNSVVRAIGQVTGDYEYKPDAPISYPHFRDVNWLVKDVEIPIEEIYEKNLQQQPIYMLKKDWVSREFFEKQPAAKIVETSNENFVLIIDEINRGNIAQIFGELITLIESDKREGGKEELKAILPYSKKPFSVPSNLFIIGTMNTADRSIEALDTALRRRFTFDEMPPKPKVIEKEGALKEEKSEIHIGVSTFQLSTILETINKRIEKLLDKDHLIGHSYFMNVDSVGDLQRVFYRNIIPLLEEYFYGDKGKIELVLGKGFIQQSENSGDVDLFAVSDYDDAIFEDRKVWELTNVWRSNEKLFEDALVKLLNSES